MYHKFLFTLIWICCTGTAYSQKQNNNWCFGRNAGINFNTTPPTPFYSSISAMEANASVSDRHTGKLLFYADGSRIWNRNHAIMPNGVGIGKDFDNSCHQGAVIAPHLSDSNLYYVFSLEAGGLSNGVLRYSIVDMRLDGGLGDVVPGVKAIPIDSNFSEAMTLTSGASCDLWLIVARRDKFFYAYHISPGGINTTPVISAKLDDLGYTVKVSPDRRKLITAQKDMYLYDFDKSTGIGSNGRHIDTDVPCAGCPGVSIFTGFDFSLNSSKLYVSSPSNNFYYQYDLSSGTASVITASKIPVNPPATGGPAALQQGPNGFIYGASFSPPSLPPYLSTITNADMLYPGCTFTDLGQILTVGTSPVICFPQPVIYPDVTTLPVNLGSDTVLCKGESITLTHNNMPGVTYTWRDGSKGSSYPVSAAGKYYVTASTFLCSGSDTMNALLTEIGRINIGADTQLCPGVALRLDAPDTFTAYKWSTGATTRFAEVNKPGQYTVTVFEGRCSLSDTVNITEKKIQVSLPDDMNICPGANTTLTAAGDEGAYLWNTGETTASIDVKGGASYWLRLSRDGCTATDTAWIGLLQPELQLPGDTLLCNGETLLLAGNSLGNSSYLWQDGSMAREYTINQSGMYWVTADNQCGRFSDSIYVAYENCDCHPFVPSAFTPNADGLNDKVHPKLDCAAGNYKFMIMDRFGEVVFSSDNPADKWDGTYKGVTCDLGTYYYLLRFEGPRKRPYTMKGDITLIR